MEIEHKTTAVEITRIDGSQTGMKDWWEGEKKESGDVGREERNSVTEEKE